jgi:TrmH family RNA methyltransferase
MHSIKPLASAQNDTFKNLSRLMQYGRERRQQGVLVLEGIHLCDAALHGNWNLGQVFVNQRALDNPEVQALLQRLPASATVFSLDERLLTRVSTLATAPELLAICPRPEAEAAHAGDCLLLLEDIQDPGNLGTILRSAAAAGVNQVFLSAGCVDVYSPKVLRSAMGAHFSLAIHEQAALLEVLAGFDGVRLVTSLAGDRSLYAQDLSGAVAFVFGNEGAGVSAALHQAADARVRIPMPGKAESLNVAMAATLCLFERVRQREGLAAAV